MQGKGRAAYGNRDEVYTGQMMDCIPDAGRIVYRTQEGKKTGPPPDFQQDIDRSGGNPVYL